MPSSDKRSSLLLNDVNYTKRGFIKLRLGEIILWLVHQKQFTVWKHNIASMHLGARTIKLFYGPFKFRVSFTVQSTSTQSY
jgi:hypothetical protein